MGVDSIQGSNITIYLAIRHPGIRRGLHTCLALQPDITVVGGAGSWDRVVEQVGQLLPEVLLLDSSLIESSGRPAVEKLVSFSEKTRIILLDEETSNEYVQALLGEVGLTDCLALTAVDEIAAAVRRLARGENSFQ